jgi:hypothetical protein
MYSQYNNKKKTGFQRPGEISAVNMQISRFKLNFLHNAFCVPRVPQRGTFHFSYG